MSDEQEKPITGPYMVVATPVMKRGPARISKIGSDITLPRAVRVSALIATGFMMPIGLIVGLIVGGLQSAVYGAIIFGLIGYALVTYSPLQGESFLKWAQLAFDTKRRATFEVDGYQAQVAVGIHPVKNPKSGEKILHYPGAIRIQPSQYDLRGVRITDRNQNMDEVDASLISDEFYAMAVEADAFPSEDDGMEEVTQYQELYEEPAETYTEVYEDPTELGLDLPEHLVSIEENIDVMPDLFEVSEPAGETISDVFAPEPTETISDVFAVAETVEEPISDVFADVPTEETVKETLSNPFEEVEEQQPEAPKAPAPAWKRILPE